MLGIHVHKSTASSRFRFSEHVLLIQALSAYYWKLNNGPIHLYTTKEDLKFYTELGIDKLYDHIDTEILEKDEDVYWPHFYPASKMKVLNSIREFPVAFIDTDFIYKQKLEIEQSYDIAFVHDEKLNRLNYPPLEMLGKREGYEFPSIPELATANPINVGFFIVNNEKIVTEFTELALDYMKGNSTHSVEVSWASESRRVFWKSLFVEQRLLGAFVEHNKLSKLQLFPYTYHGDTGTWKSDSSEVKNSVMNLNGELPFYHLWGEKSLYEMPSEIKRKVMTFYKLCKNYRRIDDELMQDILLNIIVYTGEKDHVTSGEDTYHLREYIKMINVL